MTAIQKIVKEARLTRQQARDLRRLRDYSTAYVFHRCADTYMKCARIIKHSNSPDGWSDARRGAWEQRMGLTLPPRKAAGVSDERGKK